MEEYTYKYRDDCWFKGSCAKESKDGCSSSCSIQAEFSYLLNTSNIPKELKESVTLYPENCDLSAFETLATIKGDIENFVADGGFLYLYSNNVGNAKSTWASKLVKTYLAYKCIGNGFKNRAWFEYIPTFILLSKEFNNPDREEHLKALMSRDIVVLDDIGVVKSSNYDITCLSSIIDSRYSNGKSTIFTSNLNCAELEDAVGARLADRILSGVVLEFSGSSRRKSKHTYTPKGDKN